MDNSNFSRNNHNEHLGVNKMGKNIRKSPLLQPNFGNSKQQPQPQIYNISKNEFRNIVQQLTGSPSHDPLPRPPHNPPRPPSMRLQKIRPPPLTPINRPQNPPSALAPFNNSFVRPSQLGQPPSHSPQPPLTPEDSIWSNTNESPISAYMRYLQTSIIDSVPRPTPPQLQSQQLVEAHMQARPLSSSGLLPAPPVPPFPSPSPRANVPALLPSPTSQFLLPSPSGFWNMLSPRSPYPLLSPGYQYPPPLTSSFSFSPMSQPGILGPGPQPPPSPGMLFPLSPSGFFPASSPKWRDQ
ncbi:hypothetical protein HHK36_000776 [Tetracentron sinense]|uniref:VQ domain-containing protein n=1 Tax=Tetracentron sinense TaxID=13715 RepID=A0A835A1M0_TETSI|nr:hypothetical protein HHK36_000776 [Tetracentron sinense]